MVGKCSKCGAPTFSAKERKEQAKLAREIVDKINIELATAKILKDKLDNIEER